MSKIIPKPDANTTLEIILNEIPKNEIVAYLLKQANNDDSFKNQLLSAFDRPDSERERAVIKEFIKTTLRKNTSRGHVDWRGCDNICFEYDKVLRKEEERLSKEYCLIVFDTASQILTSCTKLASMADSSSGALKTVSDYSLELIGKACHLIYAQADDAKNKKTYEAILKQALSKPFEHWEDSSYDLLNHATIFLTEKNKAKLDDTLDKLSQRLSKRNTSNYYKTAQSIVQFHAIEKLEGAAAAKEYILKNIDLDVFRKMAINLALQNADFDYAEKLCLEKLETMDSNFFLTPPKWFYLLYKVYETAGNIEKKANTAFKILLAGDTSYYDVLKSIYQQTNMWQTQSQSILNSLMNLPNYYNYMPIFKKEEEWQLLFEMVKKYPISVFNYGQDLAAHIPQQQDELFAIYLSEIEKAGMDATDRYKYHQVCNLIKKLFEAGGVLPAINIIDKFTNEYKRRPAMLDELMKLKKKIEKIKISDTSCMDFKVR